MPRMEQPDPDQLLTYSEAASLLRVHEKVVGEWVRAGRLRAVRLTPRAVRITRADLRRFVSAAGSTSW